MSAQELLQLAARVARIEHNLQNFDEGMSEFVFVEISIAI